eukprot:m.187573 g.187573  ORF g.187573 m.187573 type:complete len:417 (-) comp15071_c0_seq8:220-1470(-)
MPVECPGCKKEKLARDFLPGPPSVSCDHGPSTCFSCMATHFAKHSTCPECEKEVTESEIAQIKQGLKIVADPMSFRLPRAVSLGGEIVIATLEGHVYHMNAEADTPVADIKIFLEGVAGVGRRQQRLMYNNREVKAYVRGENGTQPAAQTLQDYGVPLGSRLHLIKVYSKFAGQTTIEGVARDKHGNAAGTQYDLAVDGAYAGLKVAVLQLYTGENFDFSHPTAALKQKGFAVHRWTSVPSVEELEAVLEESCQCWLISDKRQKLSDGHLGALQRFFDSSRGLYIWGDNHPFYVDANALSSRLFGVKMSGNERGCKKVQERPATSDGPGFCQHLITTGIESLYEGNTVATIEPSDKFTPIMNGSAGNLILSAYDTDGKRALIDGAFTRLFCDWDDAGSARYVINAAAWLCNFEADW